MGFPGGSVVKSPPANARDAGSVGSQGIDSTEVTEQPTHTFSKQIYSLIKSLFCVNGFVLQIIAS